MVSPTACPLGSGPRHVMTPDVFNRVDGVDGVNPHRRHRDAPTLRNGAKSQSMCELPEDLAFTRGEPAPAALTNSTEGS